MMRCCRSTTCRSSATCSSRDKGGLGLPPADCALDPPEPAALPGRDGCWAVRGLPGCLSMMSYHSSSVPYGSMRAWHCSCLRRQHLPGAEGQQLLRVSAAAAQLRRRAADKPQDPAAPGVLGRTQVMCVFRRWTISVLHPANSTPHSAYGDAGRLCRAMLYHLSDVLTYTVGEC
jgi:hypothetical protein